MKLNDRQLAILRQAAEIQELQAKYDPEVKFTRAEIAQSYFTNLLSGLSREVFQVALLDNQHRLIKSEQLFTGTIDGAAVYPREVVKLALLENASAVIIAHNHPSGITEPSDADIRITKRIKEALGTVDIRLLDHIIVGNKAISLTAMGRI